MAAQAAAQKAVLETMQMQQAQRMNMQNSKSRTKNKTSNGGINKNNAALRNVPGLLPNNFQIQGGQLIQVSKHTSTKSLGEMQDPFLECSSFSYKSILKNNKSHFAIAFRKNLTFNFVVENFEYLFYL